MALEAAAHGAKVVITSKGGPPDYFGQHATYVHSPSVKSISDAVTESWNNVPTDDLKDHVLQNLSWQNSAKHIHSLYIDILNTQ